MSQELARLIITAIAAVLVGRQALHTERGTRKRQAFTLGAAGFAVLAVANAMPILGGASPFSLTLAVGVGLALLLGCLVSLFLAYRDGEMKDQFRRAGAMVADEREKLAERERRASEERKKTR
jgi:hypothetical protein